MYVDKDSPSSESDGGDSRSETGSEIPPKKVNTVKYLCIECYLITLQASLGGDLPYKVSHEIKSRQDGHIFFFKACCLWGSGEYKVQILNLYKDCMTKSVLPIILCASSDCSETAGRHERHLNNIGWL